MASKPVYDALIIGGGPAGLSTALGLSRILHTAVLFDSGVYRNQLAKHMHIVSTWDHQDPEEFRAAARKELTARYDSVRIQNSTVEKVEKLENGWFKATDASQQEWTGKKLVLATGSKDVFPNIPGYEECWVKGIFHCLFCHGFEENGTHSAGVLAVDDAASLPVVTQFTGQARRFTQNVTAYTNGSASLAAELAPLAAKNIRIDSRPIKQLVKTPGDNSEVTIVFDDGETETVGFLVHKAKTVLASQTLVEQLGLELTPSGDLKVAQPIPMTSVPGVYAAGDCSTFMKMVTNALASGIAVAAGVSMQLQSEA